jgi:hypothetical protein
MSWASSLRPTRLCRRTWQCGQLAIAIPYFVFVCYYDANIGICVCLLSFMTEVQLSEARAFYAFQASYIIAHARVITVALHPVGIENPDPTAQLAIIPDTPWATCKQNIDNRIGIVTCEIMTLEAIETLAASPLMIACCCCLMSEDDDGRNSQ